MARGDRSGELLPWPPIADTLSPTVTLNPTMTRSHDMSERHDRLMKILTEQQTTSLSKDNEAGNATLTEAQAQAARRQLLYGDRGPSLPAGAHARLIAACTR